jgi:hypothetical protein
MEVGKSDDRNEAGVLSSCDFVVGKLATSIPAARTQFCKVVTDSGFPCAKPSVKSCLRAENECNNCSILRVRPSSGGARSA